MHINMSMGAAESKSTPGADPFGNVKIAWAPPVVEGNIPEVPHATNGAGGVKHKSPAQLKLEEDANNHKSWVYKNERRAAPTEVRKSVEPQRGSRRTQSARPGVSLMNQMADLGIKEEHVTREQKLQKEKEDFMKRVTAFMQGNVAIRPPPSAQASSTPRLPIVPPIRGMLPEGVKEAWMQKLLSSREQILEALKARPDKDTFVEPKTEEDVSVGVEKSLGSTFDTFTSFQRTINQTISAGLTEELLQQLLLNDKEPGSRDLQSVQQGWRAVGAAVEGVMQVYVNRSNSRFIMNEDWVKPTVVDGHGTQAQVYIHGAETMVAQSMVALLYIDTGHLVQVGEREGSYAAVLSTDLWQAIKRMAPSKVPNSQRLERVSLFGRHLLQAAITVEMHHGKMALSKLKVIVAVDQEQELFAVTELKQWGFFGLHPQNVVVLPLPRFPGFAQDSDEVLRPVENSPKVLYGAGYAVSLLQAPAAGYTLDPTGNNPAYLPASVLEWLREGGVSWLYSGMFYDAGRVQVFDSEFLAGALYASEREGANMAVQVIRGEDKQQVRIHDSILLGRKREGDGMVFACDLCSSSMRTVRSYQVLQAQLAEGFHVSTHRYLYKVSALTKLLQHPEAIPLDLMLHGYYAYGTMKLNSITCLPDANCVAIMCPAPPGPPMEHAVLGVAWLEQAAHTMAEQDKVDAFRKKAISLADVDELPNSLVTGLPRELKRIQTLQPQRVSRWKSINLKDVRALSAPKPDINSPQKKPGRNVLLIMSMEHRGPVAKAAFNLARLGVKNIVDRLHVHVIKNATDSESLANEMLKELSDKELDFNNQLVKSWVPREPDQKTADLVQDSINTVDANLIVVPDCELGEASKAAAAAAAAAAASTNQRSGGPNRQLSTSANGGSSPASTGPHPAITQATSNSLAMLIARTVTRIPVLVVKHNSAGRFAFGGGNQAKAIQGHPPLHIMVHLEILAVSLMVELACQFLTWKNDVLFLAKTRAFEKTGQPTMRTNRMMVQGKMAASGPMRVEERMYADSPLTELTKAVEAEQVDMVMVSTTGEMPISKETEELLLSAKSSVLLFRHKEMQNVTKDSMPMQVIESPT